MKVHPINNQNQTKQCDFGAKCSIGGDLSLFEPSQIAKWKSDIGAIGTDKDGIVIHIGNRYYQYVTRYILGLIPKHEAVQGRSIFALASIGSQICDKDLSYYMQEKNFDDKTYMMTEISNYIQALNKLA